MIITEKTISNLIESHFPFFFREENPLLVEFVKKYYEWLEADGNTLYHTRRLSSYKNIDDTVDEFVIYFKEKYLKNIQFETAASTRRMVKHSLDLYRSKGTPRAIDLMFKVVFDTPAEVYLPSKDIFKLSAGDYYEQQYLEVTPSPLNILFVGKQVTGLQTNAKAFVEKLIRKKVKGIYVEVFTISNLVNNVDFITGEVITIPGQISIKDNPKVIGSLTKVDILSGSSGFNVGDIVDVESALGIGAKARITSISSVTGQVDFTLRDGGFGYSSNADIYVSEKVIKLKNVITNTSISPLEYFNSFDDIIVPQSKIQLTNLSSNSSLLNVGDQIRVYYTNNDVKGYGTIQSVDVINDTVANVYVSVIEGDLVSTDVDTVNAYFISNLTVSNTHSANLGVAGFEDMSVYAKVIGTKDVITIDYANSSVFNTGELVYQISNNNIITASAIVSNSVVYSFTGKLTLANTYGVFDANKKLLSNTTNRSADISDINIDVGINIAPQNLVEYTGATNTFNQQTLVYMYYSNNVLKGTARIIYNTGTTSGNIYFYTLSGNMQPVSGAVNNYYTAGNVDSMVIDTYYNTTKGQIYSNAYNRVYAYNYESNVYAYATVTSISNGSLASFEISSILSNPEVIQVNTDLLRDHDYVILDASDYYLQTNSVVNGNTIIANGLNFKELTIGTIKNLTGINYGTEYDAAPIVKIVEPVIYAYDKKDIFISIANTNGLFFNGEILSQPSTGAKGIIKSSNDSILEIRPINFENDFSSSVSNTTIRGSGSGTTAKVLNILVDYRTEPMGYNAVVQANVVSQSGSVTGMEIVDSGYGYAHEEFSNFYSDDRTKTGTVVALLGTRTAEEYRRGRQGKSIGRYRDQNGFLSVGKKLQDGDYYQEFSYEVRSSVTLDKYEAMLKQLLHVAGTKYFAATVRTSVLTPNTNIQVSIESTRVVTADATQYANGYPITSDSTTLTMDLTKDI